MNNKLYIGQTQNVHQRIRVRNSDRVKSTKNLGPWALLALKECNSRSDAAILERKLKNLRSKKRIMEYIQKNGFECM